MRLAFNMLRIAPRFARPLGYGLALLLALFSGMMPYAALHHLGHTAAELFIRLFKLISLPLFSLSLIVTLAQQRTDGSSQLPWCRTLCYTLITTLIAATLSCLLYVTIQPQSIQRLVATPANLKPLATHYGQHLLEVIPTTLFGPFIAHQVIGVLFISLLLGLALRSMALSPAQGTLLQFFQGLHQLLLTVTRWIVLLLPIGLFGFVTEALLQVRQGELFRPLSGYLMVVVAANLIQGLFILPVWLWWQGIPAWASLRAMLPALSVAFFSKSSTATLPITLQMAEQRLKITPAISRFVLPLCTTLNMNGCAAFIFTTVIYLMQNAGMSITPATLVLWIGVATIAAIGNAGVPMGCFFLSTALLTSMNIPVALLGVILPFYTVIDMLETALNVWSDSCVAMVVHHKTQSASRALLQNGIKG